MGKVNLITKAGAKSAPPVMEENRGGVGGFERRFFASIHYAPYGADRKHAAPLRTPEPRPPSPRAVWREDSLKELVAVFVSWEVCVLAVKGDAA